MKKCSVVLKRLDLSVLSSVSSFRHRTMAGTSNESDVDENIEADEIIEADAEMECDDGLEDLFLDEDLNAAFETEHGHLFQVVDEIGLEPGDIDEDISREPSEEKGNDEHAEPMSKPDCKSAGSDKDPRDIQDVKMVQKASKDYSETKSKQSAETVIGNNHSKIQDKQQTKDKKRFVIPKLKRAETEKEEPPDANQSSNKEGKLAWSRHDSKSKHQYDRNSTSRSQDSGKEPVSKNHHSRHKDKSSSDGHHSRRDSHGKNERDKHHSHKHRHSSKDSHHHSGSKTQRESFHSSSEIKRKPCSGSSTCDDFSVNPSTQERASLFDSFAAEGLIAADDLFHAQMSKHISFSYTPMMPAVQGQEVTVKKEPAMEASQTSAKNVPKETEDQQGMSPDDSSLEIPMGRDSLVFIREFYPWQVRLHPVLKQDVTKAEFANVWSIADSASVAWSTSPDFGGVSEFLLKEYDSIQKFMRKLMWYVFTTETLTLEVTERKKVDLMSSGLQDTFDNIANHVTFQFNNAKARQLIKTYYPAPTGEVTERSLYVNNVGGGASADIVKSIFPCALKITVPKAGKDVGTFPAIVEVESGDAAFNYLVAYGPIRLNNRNLVLSTVHCDWQEAKTKFLESEKVKEKNVSIPGKPAPAKPAPAQPAQALGIKRPAPDTMGEPSKRGRPGLNRGAPTRGKGPGRGAPPPGTGPERGAPGMGLGGSSDFAGRGAPLRGRGTQARGRGGPPGRGRGGGGLFSAPPAGVGRTLLPNPIMPVGGGGGGLLPDPPIHRLGFQEEYTEKVYPQEEYPGQGFPGERFPPREGFPAEQFPPEEYPKEEVYYNEPAPRGDALLPTPFHPPVSAEPPINPQMNRPPQSGPPREPPHRFSFNAPHKLPPPNVHHQPPNVVHQFPSVHNQPPKPQPPPKNVNHPPSLLNVPARPTQDGLREADIMLKNNDLERRAAELEEMHQHLESKVQETRASLMRAAHQKDIKAAKEDLKRTLGEFHDLVHNPGPPKFNEDVDDRRPPPRDPSHHPTLMEGPVRPKRDPNYIPFIDDVEPPMREDTLSGRPGTDGPRTHKGPLFHDEPMRRDPVLDQRPPMETKERREPHPSRHPIFEDLQPRGREELADEDRSFRQPLFSPSVAAERRLPYEREPSRPREEDLDIRSLSKSHAFLLEKVAGRMEGKDYTSGRLTFDYSHSQQMDDDSHSRRMDDESHSRRRVDGGGDTSDMNSEERQALLKRLALGFERQEEPRPRSSREVYEYDRGSHTSSYPPGHYEDDDRHSTKYRIDYDHHF